MLKIIQFFKSLPLYIDVDVEAFGRQQYYVICHAALSNNVLDDNGRIDRTQCRENHDSFNKVLDEYILWERNYWGNNWNYDTIVVHGHTPTCTRDLAVRGSNPGRIDFRRKDINVDCGMCFGIEVSNLAAICLETLDEYYAVDTEDCSLAAMSNSEAYKKDMLHFIKTGHDIEEQSLDVEDTKSSIEKELVELYKPQNRAVQPDIVAATAITGVSGGTKGVGTLDGRIAIKPKTKGGMNKIWAIIAVLVLVIASFVVLNKESGTLQEVATAPSGEEQVQPAKSVQATQGETTSAKQDVANAQPKKAEQTVVKEVKDANYDAGMKAYEAKNGLEAINAFKSSGSAEAYYMLGVIYENGCGNVGKNAMMARKNFKKAAQMGSEKAKAKL